MRSEASKERAELRATMIGIVIVICAATVTGALMVAAVIPGGKVVGGCGLAGAALLCSSWLRLSRRAKRLG